MASLTTAQVRTLLTPPAPPCVSLYLTTHPNHPDAQQNTRLYREAVDAAERSLAAGYPAAAKRVVDRLRQLEGDGAFWAAATAGLGVFAGADFFQTVRLAQPVDGLAVVADSFHVKPLLRAAQSADRFQVLAVTRTDARVFEGDWFRLTPLTVHLPTPLEAIGLEHGQRQAPHPGANPSDERSDNLDLDKYFREVDKAVLDKVSRPSGLPLVLIGLTANQAGFRKSSHNPHLLPDGVPHNPGAMTLPEIRDAAWAVVEPQHRQRLAKLTDGFRTALPRKMAADGPAEVAKAVVAARVGLLLVDADKVVPGKFDPGTGAIELCEPDAKGVDDLLDDLAEQVLKTGGEVVVVPSDQMPTASGVAAVFRY